MRFLVALVAALAVVPVALAGDPRAERQRLNAADMALARKATVRASDLTPGWRRMPVGNVAGEVPRCPGYAPDFSRFTITGRSRSAFQHPAGASIVSSVEVYPSRAQAVGDYRLGTQPGLARCLRLLLDRDFAAMPGVDARIVSSRRVPAPALGERSAAYRLAAEFRANGRVIRLFIDVIALQRGRSLAAVFYTGVYEPVADRASVARAVAARMR
jgi:hypothetical protein